MHAEEAAESQAEDHENSQETGQAHLNQPQGRIFTTNVDHVEKLGGSYPTWLWLTWPWYRWPIEIDCLPIKRGDFPWLCNK